MDWILEKVTYLYDPLHDLWECERTQKRIAGLLILAYLLGILGIELNRRGLLPPEFAAITPHNHFHAVSLAFTFVLTLEVVSLIFTLPCSVSKSVGKQLEILSLILLRNSFKELSSLPEPVVLSQGTDVVLRIMSDAGGALCIFVALGFYYRLQRHAPVHKDKLDRYGFVATKKAVSLLLLLLFAAIGLSSLWGAANGGKSPDFFATFYTLLIFSDILIVLISQRYQPAFHAVFRNSGYALSTLLMRLSLSAPRFLDAAIGVAAAIFAVALTLAFNAFARERASAAPIVPRDTRSA